MTTVSPHQIWRLTGSYEPTPQESGKALLEICRKDGMNLRDVTLLLDAKADLTLCDEFNRTALYNCSFMGHAHAIPLLIAAGADPNVFDLRHQFCIENAIVARQLACVNALIDGNVDIEAACTRGKTPLLLAVSYNCDDIAFALLKAGADMDARDWEGQSAIDIARAKDANILADKLQHYYDNDWEKKKLDRYCNTGMPINQAIPMTLKLRPKKSGMQP